MARAKSSICKRGHEKPAGGSCLICAHAANKAWRERNREYNQSRLRQWYAAHCQDSRAYAKARYYQIRATFDDDTLVAIGKRTSEKVRAWRKAHPEEQRVQQNRYVRVRQMRKRGAFGTHTEEEWQFILVKHHYRCARCGVKQTPEMPLEQDHITPVSRGGSDMALNIQPMCPTCNKRKSASIAVGAQATIFDRLGT